MNSLKMLLLIALWVFFFFSVKAKDESLKKKRDGYKYIKTENEFMKQCKKEGKW